MKETLTKMLIIAFSFIVSRIRGKRKPPARDKVRRIAVLQMSGIGDLLLITPALRALHKYYPLAEMDILTYRLSNAQFLFRFPHVSGGCEFPLFDMELKHFWKAQFRIHLKKVLSFLRSGRYDMYISFHHTWLAQWYFIELLAAACSGAGFCIGINPSYVKNKGVFDLSLSEADLRGHHYSSVYLSLLNKLGNTSGEKHTEFPLTHHEMQTAYRQIRQMLPYSRKIICIHAGSSYQSKCWPVENYKELCIKLTRAGYGVILTGSEKECLLSRQIVTNLPPGSFLNATGETDIFQTAALIAVSDLFIGNDSGPLHIAIARGCTAIGIIASEIPQYHSYNQKNIILFTQSGESKHAGVPEKETKHQWTITANQVFEEAVKILS